MCQAVGGALGVRKTGEINIGDRGGKRKVKKVGRARQTTARRPKDRDERK